MKVVLNTNTHIYEITVQPVLNCHLWAKKNWSSKTGDLLKEI